MNANVRTFRATSPRAALDAVKAALGDDAVILETREIRGGLWGRTEIEVTAASSADPAPGPLDRPPPAATSGPELEGEIASLRRVVDELRRELRAARVEPRELGAPGLPPDALRLHRRLTQRGVDDALAEELVQKCVRDAGGTRAEDLLEALRGLLRRRMPPARPPWEVDGRKALAVVGPTGVGKTTSLAKIAARALLEGRLKVHLVTVDTYRIGASEHIGRYAEIMGIPLHVARDAVSLRAALARTQEQGAQLVLIDTAGRSDPAALAAQADLLRTVPGLETHLVLSAASGARELAAAARRYRDYEISRLLFSKLDEADGPGGILSAAAVVPCPVSCVADGQRVPDDLHPVTGPRLVEIVLGK
jgi:flagellar biosynthesis protein FlhF